MLPNAATASDWRIFSVIFVYWVNPNTARIPMIIITIINSNNVKLLLLWRLIAELFLFGEANTTHNILNYLVVINFKDKIDGGADEI